MVPQGDEVEQRHHPEGVGGLHPQAAKRTAAGARDGGEAAEAGDHQPLAAAAHPGEERGVGPRCGWGSTANREVL